MRRRFFDGARVADNKTVDWHEFPEGEEPELLTGISIFCQVDKHEECPGPYRVPEHGDETVFCVCSCHRVSSEREQWPIIGHADIGDPDCPGCIGPVIRGDVADITCNECGTVVRSVPFADLQRTYDEIELSLDATATEMCPHCGNVNIFTGWASMMAYTCRGCGKIIRLSDDPGVEKLFGPEER